MAPPAPDRLPLAALGFGLAAALSSWNPLSAPFGVLVGLVSLLLAARALVRAGAGTGRRVAIAAFALSFLAVAAGSVVLALTAGVGRELVGTPIVPVPARQEVSSELDRADERTRAARERARTELERLEPPAQPAPPRDTRATTR